MADHIQSKWRTTYKQNGGPQTNKMADTNKQNGGHKQTKWRTTNKQNGGSHTNKMADHKQTKWRTTNKQNGGPHTNKMADHKQTKWRITDKQNGGPHTNEMAEWVEHTRYRAATYRVFLCRPELCIPEIWWPAQPRTQTVAPCPATPSTNKHTIIHRQSLSGARETFPLKISIYKQLYSSIFNYNSYKIM